LVDRWSRTQPADVSGVRDAGASSEQRDTAWFERLLLANLSLVDRVVAFIARRNGLDAATRDDVAAIVRLKLIDNDYQILKKFEGRSSFETYLATVVQRIVLDERIRQWGKWRPSAEAKRLGPLAMRLELLLSRDGLGREEAFRSLETSEGTSRAELEAAFVRLPPRTPRREVGEAAMESLADSGANADQRLREREARGVARRAQVVLNAALGDLPSEDRLIMKMRFEDSFTVADIAVALKLEARPLYRRIEATLHELRRCLEDAGLDAGAVVSLIGVPEADIRIAFLEKPGSGPSKKEM
jgi:RNA polymerase sigma factor (sigma-70 family)